MTPNVKDFQALIRWLAETYHDGAYYPIAKKTGLSSALIDQWKHGIVHMPKITSLNKLCAAYGLNFDKVVRLFRGAAVILLTLATAAGVYFADSPPAVAQTIDSVRLITPPRRRQWGWFHQWTLALA